MATNHDKAARFAAVITHYLTTAKLHTPHDACNYLDCLPRKLRRQPASQQTMQPVLATDNSIKFMAEECGSVFLPLSNGYSYAERVARIVWNTHTQTPELWLTPQRFSNTTARHKMLYLNAYANACRIHGFTPTTYNTEGVSSQGITRATRVLVDREKMLNRCTDRMYDAILPKLHESTRWAAITEAKYTLEYQLRLLTENTPPAEQMYATQPGLRESHEQTVWALTEKLDYIATLQTLDTKTMRAALAGLKALDTE